MPKKSPSLCALRPAQKQAARRLDSEAVTAGKKSAAQVNRDNSLAAQLSFKPKRLPGLGIHRH